MRRWSVAVIVLALCAPGTGTARATFIEYFGINTNPGGSVSGPPLAGRNAFLAEVDIIGVEDLEDVTGSGSALDPFALNFTGSEGPVTGSFATDGTINLQSSSGGGRFATSGSHYIRSNSQVTINFLSPIQAFGFYVTDAGDVGDDLVLTLSNESTRTVTVDLPNTDASLLFWGFTDSANFYSSITVSTTPANSIGYDDLTIGQFATDVPEPSTLALFGLGLAGLAWVGRRRLG